MLTIIVKSLYKYSVDEDKLKEYKLVKVTPKRIYTEPPPKYYSFIDRSEIGVKYFISKEQAIRHGILGEAANNWLYLGRKLKESRIVEKRCERENINSHMNIY